MSEQPLLRVENLQVHFPFTRGGFLRSQRGVIRAVDDVSFDIAPGETLGLVGESGCGKSTTARAIVGLVQPTAGRVMLGGERIDGLSDAAMQRHRRVVQMVFQDPFASLNPRMSVGSIIGEPLKIHGLARGRDLQLEVLRLMDLVGLNPRFLNRYPHEFSGGQRQRIGIARALAVQPQLILCDEPVSALDVSIQAQVLTLLKELQDEMGLSMLFISHDLAVVRYVSDDIMVLYLGRLVEYAPRDILFEKPRHPYTRALIASVLSNDPRIEREHRSPPIGGDIPSPINPPSGCPFHTRCPLAERICREQLPELELWPDGAKVACHVANRDLAPNETKPQGQS